MKQRTLSVLAIAACSSATAQVLCVKCYDQDAALNTTSPNLISNGSFESSDCTAYPFLQEFFCPSSMEYSCDLEDWACTGGGEDTYAMLFDSLICNIADGAVGAYLGNHYCNLCSSDPGDTTCLQMDGCVVTGILNGYPLNQEQYGGDVGVSLSQTVTGLLPNSTYILEFWAGGENFGNFFANGVFAVDVGFGNIFLRCKPTALGQVGTRYQVIFTSNGPSHTIKFTNWGHIGQGVTEVILDDVRLIASPGIPCGPTQVSTVEVGPERVRFNEDQVMVNAAGYADARLTLYDMAGRVLLVRSITGVQYISLEHLPQGVISYQLSADGVQSFTGRLVKL